MSENIRKAIEKVKKWLYDWGFKLSKSKSCCMFFLHVGAEKLTLYGQPMEMVSELKYLGLDSRCTWEACITHLKTKCKKKLLIY